MALPELLTACGGAFDVRRRLFHHGSTDRVMIYPLAMVFS